MRNLNPPNVLTGLRLLAAPLLAFLLLHERQEAALAVFALAGASDAADGWLAKHFGWTTDLGRILDPAADKMLMLAALVGLAATGGVPLWLAALVIGRDAVLVAGASLAWILGLPFKVAPSPLGKVSTVLQVIYIATVLALPVLGLEAPGAVSALGIAMAVATLAAGLSYAGSWVKALARALRLA